jgi:hypothetical protein
MKHCLIASILLLSTTLAGACSWNNPGRNPFKGDVVKAVDHYPMPAADKRVIQEKIKFNNPDDTAIIDKDEIYGNKVYEILRGMHFGNGQVCATVDRSQWGSRIERGHVYCSNAWCVIIPTICNNVSLVTRVPPNYKPLTPQGDDGGPGLRLFTVAEPVGLATAALLAAILWRGRIKT